MVWKKRRGKVIEEEGECEVKKWHAPDVETSVLCINKGKFFWGGGGGNRVESFSRGAGQNKISYTGTFFFFFCIGLYLPIVCCGALGQHNKLRKALINFFEGDTVMLNIYRVPHNYTKLTTPTTR